jgi:hypothetical protein
MASLLTTPKLGNTGVSSLIKSAQTLSNELNTYTDQVAALTYANSAYTDEAYSQYQTYLQSRIGTLNATGSITDASKALTLTKTLESATHSNISASITRENIQIMAGNATLQDKYNVITDQFQRAQANGDETLAQTLMSQAYSVSQTIQSQAQTAADAAATLAKAGNGTTTGTSGVTYQGEVVTNLKTGLDYLNGLAKNASEKELNATLTAFAKQQAPVLAALGVNIQGNQPNYFDVVYGVAGAMYNASVLKAQAEAPINPLLSQTYATDAANYLNGNTKFQTLGGNLTVQQIQQAQQDPNMFTYDNTTGKYTPDIQSGYQYMNFTDSNGQQTTQLVPQYSNFASTTSGRKAFNQVQFLTPQETTTMTKLGLNFTENASGTTGNGVQFSVTQNTPQWLKAVLGDKGIGNIFTGQDGFVNFKAGASNGQGDSYYTLTSDNKGLAGLYEHQPNGNTQLIGGDYGFNSGAVQLLINAGQQTQYQVQLAQQQTQQKLQMQQQQATQALQVQQVQQQAQAAATSQVTRLQPAASPAPPTFNPQQTASPQPPTFNPQQTVNGNNLNQSGSGGIKLGSSSGPSIRL